MSVAKSNVVTSIRRFCNSYSKIFLEAQPTEYNSRRPKRDQAIARFKTQCDTKGFGFDRDSNMPIVDSKVSVAHLWLIYGSSMVYLWLICGLSVAHLWFIYSVRYR